MKRQMKDLTFSGTNSNRIIFLTTYWEGGNMILEIMALSSVRDSTPPSPPAHFL